MSIMLLYTTVNTAHNQSAVRCFVHVRTASKLDAEFNAQTYEVVRHKFYSYTCNFVVQNISLNTLKILFYEKIVFDVIYCIVFKLEILF